MKSRNILCVSVCLAFVALYSHALCADEISFPRVILGMAFDKDGSMVSSDFQIQYALKDIEKRLKPEDINRSVRYLPPLSVNYEDRVTKKGSKESEEDLCEKTIEELFAAAFTKYTGKKARVEDYTLLTARQATPETRQLIAVWWFTYIHKDKLKQAE